jgi:voltage-gated potassium channel
MEVLDNRDAAERLGVMEVLTLIFSVYVIVVLLIQATGKVSQETAEILDWIDLIVCAVFLSDFFVRFHRAPLKTHFLKWNWIDVISSIPMIPIFRVGRVVRGGKKGSVLTFDTAASQAVWIKGLLIQHARLPWAHSKSRCLPP